MNRTVFALLSPPLRLNLGILFTAGLLFWAALTALLPTLPLYIAQTGANGTTIGVVIGSFAIGLLSSRSYLSQLADSRGRKPVLLIGMAAVAIAPLCYLTTHSIPLLIAIRAFHGLSISAFALAYSALVVDLSPPQHRGELIGYMSLVNPIGMALGPALGGFLYEWNGYLPAFLAAALLGTMGLVIVGLINTNQVQKAQSHSSDPLQPVTAEPASHQFWQLLGSDRVRIPTVVLLLIGLAFGALSTFVPLFIQESQVSLNVGLLYTAAAIASFSIRLVVGRASDQHGRGLFITLSLGLYMLAMTVLWRATSAPLFLIAGILEGCGAGILIPMMAALMADRSYPNERGRMFSLCMVGFDVGIAVAGPVLGTVATYTGYRAIFGICASLVALSLVIFLTLSSKTLIYSFQFATGKGKDIYAVEHQ